jgi:hypothetical protein
MDSSGAGVIAEAVRHPAPVRRLLMTRLLGISVILGGTFSPMNEPRAEISGLRMEMHDGLAEVKVALAGVESKIDRRFADLVKWSFLFWCGAAAATAAAAALTRLPR